MSAEDRTQRIVAAVESWREAARQGKARPRRKSAIPTEDVEQNRLAGILNGLGLRWCHVPNGGHRHYGQAVKLQHQGVKPGVPDCLVFDAPPKRPGKVGVAIELKRLVGGKVSVEQFDWLRALEERGWVTMVCQGASDAEVKLRDLGWVR